MADNDEVISQLYRLEIDEQRLNKLKAGVSDARKLIDQTTAAVKAQPVVFDTAGQAMDDYARKIQGSGTQLVDTADNVDLLTSNLLDLEDASDAAAAAQEKLARANKDVDNSGGSGAGGGSSSGSLGTRRLLGAVGGIANQVAPGSGQAFSIAGDVTELAKDFPKLKDALVDLSPLALAGAAALGTVAAAFVVGNALASDNTAAVRDVTGRTKEYYQLLVSGTSDVIEAKAKEAQLEQKVAQKRVDDLSFVAQGYDELHNKLGVLSGPIDAVIESAGALGAKNFKDVRDARLAYDEASTALKTANDNLAIYNGLLGDNAIKTNDTAAAIQKAEDAYAAGIVASIEGPLKAQAEYQDFISTATTEELDKKRKAAAATSELTAQELTAIGDRLAATKEGTKEYENLQNELDSLSKQFNAQSDAYELLSSSAAKAIAAENTLAQSRQKQLDDIKKYDTDLDAIDEKDYQARAGIAQKYNDTIVKAAENAASAAENALEKLIDQRDKLALSLSRADATAEEQAHLQSLNDQIKFQQVAAKSARDHARELVQIQKDGQKNEQKLIDDHDFAALLDQQMATKDALDASNEKYDNDQKEALIAYQEQDQERQRQFKADTEQRHKKYAQDLSDAQAAYNKDLQQASRARQTALNQAVAARDQDLNLQAGKYNTELNMRKNALINDLLLVQQTDQMKHQADVVYYNHLKQLIQSVPALYGSSSTSTAGSAAEYAARSAFRASGGSLSAGQVSSYNERPGQREKLNGMLLPAGAGMVIPFRGGYVDSNGGGKPSVTINGPLVAPTINAGGANAAQLSSIKDMIFDGALEALQVVTGVTPSGSPN